MSHTLTPASTLDAVTVPDPGDPRTAASVQVGFQNCANRDQWLIDHGDGGATISAGAWQMPMSHAQPDAFVAGVWKYTAGLWVQDDVSGSAALWLDLRLPLRVTLTDVHLYLAGAGFGPAHGALPANLPTLMLRKVDSTNQNSVVSTHTVTDASASQAAYDAKHRIDMNGLTEFVDPVYRFQVKITGESGANSAVDKLAVYGVSVGWTPA